MGRGITTGLRVDSDVTLRNGDEGGDVEVEIAGEDENTLKESL
jgi:hypothetical protein